MRFGVGLIGPLNSDPHRRLAPKSCPEVSFEEVCCC